MERFLAEPEALWLLAALSCHPSPFVRAAALTYLAELDGEGWALDYARLRSQDAEPRVQAVARAWLDRAGRPDDRN